MEQSNGDDGVLPNKSSSRGKGSTQVSGDGVKGLESLDKMFGMFAANVNNAGSGECG